MVISWMTGGKTQSMERVRERETESAVTWYRETLTGGMSHFFPWEYFGAMHTAGPFIFS